MDYIALRQLIIDETENDDETFQAHIDDFIRAAELRIYRELDLRAFRYQAYTQTTASDPYLALPATMQLAAQQVPVQNPIIRTLHLYTPAGKRFFLLPKNLSFIRDFWPQDGKVGVPRYYARWNTTTLALAPTPNLAYRAEMEFSAQPPSLTAGGDPTIGQNRTWLGDNAHDALLYACLIEAFAFMRGEQQAVGPSSAGNPPGIWFQKYQEASQRLAAQEARERVDDYRAEAPR